ATMTITNTLVTANSSTSGQGGGISNMRNGVVVISNCTVANNLANTRGGGFSDGSGLGNLVLLNSLFINNSALGNGGGLFVNGNRESITSSLIRGNTSG